MSMEIARLQQPQIADYQDAFRVCENVWPYLAPLNTPARFAAFHALGVEVLVARRSGQTVGACFVLPERYAAASESCDFVWLFDFAVSPEGRGAGTSLLVKAMKSYPNIMVIGVTKPAAALYEGLKWKRFDALWRCVHPLDLGGMLNAHAAAQKGPARHAARLAAPVYNTVGSLLDFGARRGGNTLSVKPGLQGMRRADDERLRAVTAYLPSVSVRNGSGEVAAVQRAGTARIVADEIRGFSRMRAHVMVWAHMRSRGAYLCEYLTTSKARALLSMLLGYLPIRMPIYYRDTNGALESYIQSLPDRQFTFSSCEKIL